MPSKNIPILRSAGFTLVELLIVITIIAVLS
ncbi:prepilin-type N-terminal cleavage/methylation domain-containing protein [Candidatus Daviesbacteria bacterium]|nr:prepilin-type N-terminal cleavage/methylation domain-containing protein [Candidatus Daviesbacteria bacterium]